MFPLSLRAYLYAHECGHHALGQVRAAAMYNIFLGPEFELAADCFSMNSLKQQRVVNTTDIETILSVIFTLPADPWNYAGPERVKRIRLCIN